MGWGFITSLALPLRAPETQTEIKEGAMKEIVAEEEESQLMEEDEKIDGVAGAEAIEYRGWKAMPYVIGNETFEKLGTIGTSSNLLVYLSTVFKMKSVGAATVLNVFNGTTNLATVLGAFLCDAYFGRYLTLGFASVASLTGMLILTLTAGISKLHPLQRYKTDHHPCSGSEPTPWQLAVLFSAFGFLVVGAGGIRPCNLAFGADQFNPHTDSGKKGINSFFNWYFFTLTFAMMVSSTIIIYIQSTVSWALGLGIPTILMFFSCVLFFIGSPVYVKVRPEGSPFTSMAQVLVAAFQKRGFELPHDPQQSLFDPPRVNSLNSKLQYTDQFRCLDKASIVTPSDEIKSNGFAANPWRLCSLQQVEEVKCLARIIPVWSTCIVYFVAIVQQSTYVVFEALQSDRHLGKTSFEIPPGSFVIFSMLAIAVWLPIYDRILVPWFTKVTGKEGGITLLQRMGIGIVISIVGMVVAALVEVKRRSFALHRPTIGTTSGGGAISSMSSLWLIPQLMLMGLSEAFTVIAHVQLYYKQFPENMKSVAGSLFSFGIACSNYISGLMVTVVHQTGGGNGKESWLAGDLNKGRLDYFYFLIATIGVVNFVYFILCARWYRYKSIDGSRDSDLEARKSKAAPV